MAYTRILEFREDFLGNKTYTSTPDANGWAVAGTGTAVTVSGTPSGAVQMQASGVGSLALYHKDVLDFDYTGMRHVLYHARLYSPNANGATFCGVASAYNSTFASVAEYMGFWIGANGAISCVTNDGVVNSGNISTNITMTSGVDYLFEVNLTNKMDVRFLVNRRRVCSSTKFIAAGYVGSLQPYMVNGITSGGTGVSSLQVDLVGIDEQCS
jgi:hypothetical protein